MKVRTKFCIVNGSGKRLVRFDSMSLKPKKGFWFTSDKKRLPMLWDDRIKAESFIHWTRYICCVKGYRGGKNLKVEKYL